MDNLPTIIFYKAVSLIPILIDIIIKKIYP